MLHSDWLSYYYAISYRPIVAKSGGLFGGKKGLKSSFNELKVFYFQYFWATSWFYKNNYSSCPHGLWVNSPFGLRAHGLLTHSPIIVKYWRGTISFVANAKVLLQCNLVICTLVSILTDCRSNIISSQFFYNATVRICTFSAEMCIHDIII